MRERVSTYEGAEIEIVYDRKLCIGAGECGRGSAALFNAKNDPWCDPNGVPPDVAADVVARCPTGALSYTLKEGQAEQAPSANIATISPDGPIYLRGDIRMEAAAGQGSPYRMALCRCGQSANKPFCDNSHKKAGFRDSGAVGQRGSGFDEGSRPLEITPARNGPLLLSGPITIRAASGREAFVANKAALCRCGHSKNKPFCDGSHRAAGFTAE